MLEEFGAAGPFGLVWMAVCAGGQVAVESGLIKESVKPFYEIVLALLAHKAINIGKTIPTALEVKEMSNALIEAEIDIGKIKAGNLAELKRANNEVTSFLDAREFQPTKNTVVPFEDPKIPITLASDTWGWKVGDSINNRTLLGEVPKWSTVSSRYWKNKALDHQAGRIEGELKYEVTEENVARMERGLAPQIYDIDSEKWISIELHHEPPQRVGELFDFVEVSP